MKYCAKNRPAWSASLAAFALLLSASLVSAQSVTLPVVNGGFEQPATPDDSRNFTTAIPGWNFTAVGGFVDDGVTNPGHNVDTFIDPVCEGDQALIIQEATLEQVIPGGLVVGTCTFEAKIWATDLSLSSNKISLFAGSHLIVELNPSIDKQWETLSHTFTVSANSNLLGETLRIEIDQWANPNHIFTYYDAISVVCTPPSTTGCVPKFASEVLNFHQGSGASSSKGPHNALGDTPNTKYETGVGGWIIVGFGDDFSTSGDSQADICVDEVGFADCYTVKVKPADSATEQALINAGLQKSGSLYKLGQTFCGDAAIDLDAIIPGFSEGELTFEALKIFDDGQGGGAEIARLEAKFVCPPPPSNCYPSFAVAVDDSMQGPHAYPNQVASGALGNDTNTRFSAGQGGFIVLSFGEDFSTSGDSQDDLCIDEYNVVDCYYVDVKPADSATEQALINAGLNKIGDFYDLGDLFCGDENVDIDDIVPGFDEGELRFESVRIFDDGSSGDGFELVRIEAKFICPGTPSVCGPEFASVVLAATQGTHALPDDGTAGALGNDGSTFWSSGLGGEITLGFGNRFSTTGDSDADLCVDEVGFPDCYFVQLDPSNALTEQALLSAGLVANGDFYDLGISYCGDEDIDIDTVVAGFGAEVLSFDAVRLVADADPVNNNGFELAGLEAKLVCSDVGPDFAKIGDRIWNDVDCDGIQDGDESGQPMVQVDLLDAAGNVIDTTTTDINGAYLFCVMPGTYSVRISPDATLFMVTAPGQGSDTELDSDFDQSSQTTGPITVDFNEERLDIDGGLCLICNTVTAFANNNLPACGLVNDPVMTASVPALGSVFTLSVDTDFPNVPIFVFFALGAPVPLTVPGSTCIIYPDLSMVTLLTLDTTDANGDWSTSAVIPALPMLAGIELTFQSRVCDPSQQGPVPGIPDFPSNASHIGIGCP